MSSVIGATAFQSWLQITMIFLYLTVCFMLPQLSIFSPWRAAPVCSWHCSRGEQSWCCRPHRLTPGSDAADLWRATVWSKEGWFLHHQPPAADPREGQTVTGQSRSFLRHALPRGNLQYTGEKKKNFRYTFLPKNLWMNVYGCLAAFTSFRSLL